MFDKTYLDKIVRYEGGVSRRLLLAYTSSLAALPFINRAAFAKRPSLSADPFTLGVASGDPDSDSVVLWTRLAPEPLDPDGGMPSEAVEVVWQIAADEAMTKIVTSGSALATPQLGHSVHVEVAGLRPDSWYWYRFIVGDAESPVGRTRTLPAADDLPEFLRFAFVSCQNFEQGLFTGYEHMAHDNVDLVVHLGDYIYEQAAQDGGVRKHLGGEIESLADYRLRYSQYRMDPLLQRMHGQCPWFVTWDDHEFDNNYAGDVSEQKDVDPVKFLLRRANAYQAYYEMMPLRRRSLPHGPHMRLYRRASFGRLAEFLILDARQYRSDQPNNDRASPLNEAAMHPANTMLGARQNNWLHRSLLRSGGNWNVLAQQVMMGMVGFPKQDAPATYSMDQWPGYAAERMRLLSFLADRRVPNPIVLTGDIHSNWVNELRVDDRKPETDVVAAEFVGTSISSGGNGTQGQHDELMASNPCVRFHNRERGYVVCEVTPEQWISDYMVIDDVENPGGKAHKRASFVVEAGSAKISRS